MSKKKHILVISQYFYPEPFRINDMCAEWVKRGYKVTVLTGIPNYPQGKYYEGYSLTKRRIEEWEGVRIIRIPLMARGSNSVGLICNYLSFAVSGYIWKCLSKIEADYVFTFEVSPMTQALIGCWYAKKHKIPHYLYVQDLWPENVITVTGINNPAIIKPIDKMVDYIYKNTDEIFATSPSFVNKICNRKVSVERTKVHYWPQYAEEFYKPMPRVKVKEIPDDNCFKVIFTGNIGTAQGLQILPKTASYLKDEDIEFVIVGDGRYYKELCEKIKLEGVEEKFVLVPRQPAERIPILLSACDAAFVSFQEDDLWKMTIPAKLQSYMACGMPIIASAQGETERIIKEAECGMCCKIGNSYELARTIKDIKNMELEKLKKNSRKYFEEHFEKDMLIRSMDKYFIQ